MERLDEAVTRILATKASLGLHKKQAAELCFYTKVRKRPYFFEKNTCTFSRNVVFSKCEND